MSYIQQRGWGCVKGGFCGGGFCPIRIEIHGLLLNIYNKSVFTHSHLTYTLGIVLHLLENKRKIVSTFHSVDKMQASRIIILQTC